MQIEKGDMTPAPKKAYQTPQLLTHGSVAKLTQHSTGGGHSDMDVAPCGDKHRYRWWDHL